MPAAANSAGEANNFPYNSCASRIVHRMIRRLLVVPLLPIAFAWARRRERDILRVGVSLTPAQIEDARAAGVAAPERVRVLVVDAVPPQLQPALAAVGRKLGLVPSATTGMSLGYGIYLRADQRHRRELLVHELVHTAQYERLGGVRPFLARYLHECLTTGYPNGPLECEAAQASRQICVVG